MTYGLNFAIIHFGDIMGYRHKYKNNAVLSAIRAERLNMNTYRFYVWRLYFPETGEIMYSSRPYSSLNRAKASLKLMAKHYASYRDTDVFHLDILLIADYQPKGNEMRTIEDKAKEDEIIHVI